MKTITAAICIAAKDLKSYFRDRTGMLLGFLLPIILVSVFGLTMSWVFGSEGGMPKSTLWVVDEDQTEKSEFFITQLRSADMIVVRPKPDDEARSQEDLRQEIADGEVHHVLVLSRGFEAAVAAGKTPELIMLRDPGREMEDQVTRISIMQAFMATSEGKMWPQALAGMMDKMGLDDQGVDQIMGLSKGIQATISAFVQSSGGEAEEPKTTEEAKEKSTEGGFDFGSFMTDMVPLTTEDIQPPERPKNLSYILSQNVAGVMVMMLMFGLMACSSMLILERESGALPRLLLAAIPRDSILLGKFFFAVVIGLIQLLILSAYGELVFEVGLFRDPITLIIISFTWVLAATSFGMLIASWAKTTKQAEGLSTILILIMAALGGCWFPIQQGSIPWGAKIVTHSTLTHWAMSTYQGMLWHGFTWSHPKMLVSLGVLWGFTILGSGVAVSFYRKRYVAG